MSDSALIQFNPDEYTRVASALKSAASALESCASSIPGASSGPSGISGRLSSCRTQLRAAASSASRLAGSAMKAANLLIECEEGLEGIAQAACSDTTRSAISEGVAFALGLYKKTGILGSTIGSIAAFSMNPTAENAVKALERSIKTYVKWEENGISSDELFGLQKYLANPSQAKNIVLATSRNLNKNLVKELDLGSVANGIGFAASLAFSGIENYEECKNNDISVDRAVVETVAEGVTSFAITGVVTAAIAMAVGGPAIAVGVTSYATIFAANALYKGVTGNETGAVEDFGHFIGDGYDTAKVVVSTCSNLIASWASSVVCE